MKDFRAIEFVTCRKQIHDRHDHIIGQETGTRVLHSLQALQKQAGAGEKNKTERHLNQNQSRTQSRSTAAADHASPFALERAGKIDMARLDGGHEREKHCRADADRYTEQENAPIQLSGIINRDPGHRWRKREHERVAAPIGDRDSAERGD